MVVVGSGHGGLECVLALESAAVDVLLVDQNNFHTFQPLLYQVATGIISEGEIAPATRVILRDQKNAQVLLGDVTRIDLEAKTVRSERLGQGAAVGAAGHTTRGDASSSQGSPRLSLGLPGVFVDALHR